MKNVSPPQAAMILSTHHNARVFWAALREDGTQLSDMFDNRRIKPGSVLHRVEQTLGHDDAWSLICQGMVFVVATDESDHVRFEQAARAIDGLDEALDDPIRFAFDWYILEGGQSIDHMGRAKNLSRAA